VKSTIHEIRSSLNKKLTARGRPQRGIIFKFKFISQLQNGLWLGIWAPGGVYKENKPK
jgi:hypothetical protein